MGGRVQPPSTPRWAIPVPIHAPAAAATAAASRTQARAEGPLRELLDRLGALYLDTGESRGLVPESHPSVVAAMRGSVMTEADVVITLGRKLDFQLAYGSPAVFGNARFVRIADTPSEMRDNRRGAAEVLGAVDAVLETILAAAGKRQCTVDVACEPYRFGHYG